MRAMRAEQFSGYEGLTPVDLPKPTVSDGKVLLRMTAAGVTPLDHTILFGHFPPAKAPLVLGNEGAGVVEEGHCFDKRRGIHKLEGKIVLIAGGNSGIGLATAKQFVNEGAYVFITGRREPKLAQAVKDIGRNVTGAQRDVANLDDLDRLFAQIKQEKGKLDILFANAVN